MRDEFLKENNKWFKIIWIPVVIMIIACLVISFFTTAGLLILILAVIYLIVGYVLRDRVVKKYKNIIIKEEFEKNGLSYISGKCVYKNIDVSNNIVAEEFYSSHIINKTTGNTFVSNDLVYGTVDNHFYRSIDIYCYYIVSTGKTTVTIPLFNGRFYAIDFSFEDDFELVIRETKEKIKDEEFEEIKFESIDFDKKYKVYSSDELKAFKYVKPQTIEKIEQLEKVFEGKLFVGIHNSKVYVGKYDNINRFETNCLYSEDILQKSIKEEIDFVKKCINVFENKDN